jgi:hypothetical protein
VSVIGCALLHHPVKDREGKTVTSAVTNLDVHDIARSARTFGLARYYVVSPVEVQHVLVQRIIEHWTTGAGRRRIPARHEALTLVGSALSLQAAVADFTERCGQVPKLIATAARPPEGRELTTFGAFRQRLEGGEREAYLILFGTGHGLADWVLQAADVLLEPITGQGYNHLSVRAAAAIVFDRLLGQR